MIAFSRIHVRNKILRNAVGGSSGFRPINIPLYIIIIIIIIILGRCRASWGEPERCAWPVSNVHGISLQTDCIQIVLAKNRSSVLM